MSDTPGRYRKVFPRLWGHPGFLQLTRSAREICLYVLSGPQSNAIGLFNFSPATAAEDLGVGAETFRKGLAEVCVTFGWQFDNDQRVFYIPSWWRWNQPTNPNILIGNLKALSEIRPSALVDAFAQNLQTLPETFHETFIECCRQRLPKPPRTQDQYRSIEQKKEKEQERERKSGSDGKRFLSIARQVLEVTNPAADLDHLVDTFFSLKPNACTKAEAREAINTALSERRMHHAS